MFAKCSSLKTINYLSSLDPSKVKSLGGMFCECASFVNLNLTWLKTKSCHNMSALFEKCVNLEKLMLPEHLETKFVKDMSFMFHGCVKLEKIDLSGIKTGNVVNMGSMFCNCESLKEIKFSKSFKTHKVMNMEKMFSGCGNLITLDLSSLKMFSGSL